jgi:uncharacterized protein (TIGR03435 family)
VWRGTRGIDQPIDALRQTCENIARKPVIDETGFDAKATFDWNLEWVDGQTFHQALASIGLELADAKRPVEFVVITPNGAGAGR